MDHNRRRIPELLCIGHMCHDRQETGLILGGTASYASLLSAHLGMDTALITSVGADFQFWDQFEQAEIAINNISAEQTTEFQNVYRDTSRIQYLHARAQTIEDSHIPVEWQQVPTIKLCLIADEAKIDLPKSFPNSFVGATIQGWLRQWDDNGLVTPKALDFNLLKGVDMIFMSEDDIQGDVELLNSLRQAVETVIMTRGSQPARIYRSKTELEFPVYPVQEIDPTGAGDVFAVSFLIHYRRTQSVVLAAAYAHSAASYVVEHVGVYLPSIEDIELRYASYIEQFIS